MKSTIVIFALAAGLLVAGTAGGTASAADSARKCGHIGFTDGSEDLAARIRASGLTCGLARDFVRDSSGRPGARFRGFRCQSTFVDVTEGLPYRRYRCTGAGDTIRWRRY